MGLLWWKSRDKSSPDTTPLVSFESAAMRKLDELGYGFRDVVEDRAVSRVLSQNRRCVELNDVNATVAESAVLSWLNATGMLNDDSTVARAQEDHQTWERGREAGKNEVVLFLNKLATSEAYTAQYKSLLRDVISLIERDICKATVEASLQ